VSGQLGDGTTKQSHVPIQVKGLFSIAAIDAGHFFSLALKDDGTVWAWGYNNPGQLGDGTTKDSSIPVQVKGLTGVTAIAAGGAHSLALKDDGTVWAWGYNLMGQLGDGTTKDSSIPVQVKGLTGVTAIAAGGGYSLALKDNGTVWAWGYNFDGQLGDGTTRDRIIPGPVGGLGNVRAIAAGDSHSLVLKDNGTVWAWGDNFAGKLGDSTTNDSRSPVQVTGLTSVVAIDAGGGHALAVVYRYQPKAPLIIDCLRMPWACTWGLPWAGDPGMMRLIGDFPGAMVIDRLPRICRVNVSCPGSASGTPGPSFYHVFIDGLRDGWNVGLFDVEGNPVEYDEFKTATGIVLSWRPIARDYVEGRIGDYLIAFELGLKGKPGTEYRVRMRIEQSDRPYAPGPSRKIPR
jgi:hypothetical protein